ncbi:hypothetical protein MHL30_17010 [Priestia flexa]|uniref:hypothetical protein n=1 Tax=Priestia flexa TaxID=86664 RepID=UPI001EF6A97F|nr:hypothetical protein [Priestia flexa]MCG7314821.1 hypothetical protein [Priestia flexa]
MLQIISGKFFNSDTVYSTPCKAVLYSNYYWPLKIETCIGTLEPIDNRSEINTYIFHYNNQIEKDMNSGFNLVRVGDPEIVQQFMLLCSFGLQAIFSTDKDEVERLCRTSSSHFTERYQPSKFLNRFFDPKINGNQEEVNSFIELVKSIIGLNRETYKAVINGFYNFFNSFINLNTNIEASYVSLVYCLESFSQNFDEYEPQWEDYSQNIRVGLEEIFEGIEEGPIQEIKSVLLQNAFLKLQKRFIEFIKDNVNDSYFVEEAVDINRPLKKSELDQVLFNAYDMRSKYVHELKPLLKHLTFPDLSNGEVFTWEHNVYLTYSGLVRLTLHTIKNFIYKQPTIEKEEYDWNGDLPGSINLYLSPEYWIGSKESYGPIKSLEALLNLTVTSLYSGDYKLPDMNSVLELIEESINSSKKPEKHLMFAFYIILNDFYLKEDKRDNYEKVIRQNKELLTHCNIENMVLALFNDDYWIWSATDCETIFKRYLKKRFLVKNISLPSTIEVSLLICIANLYFDQDNLEKYKELIKDCICELSGNKNKQEYLQKAIVIPRNIDINFLFGK